MVSGPISTLSNWIFFWILKKSTLIFFKACSLRLPYTEVEKSTFIFYFYLFLYFWLLTINYTPQYAVITEKDTFRSLDFSTTSQECELELPQASQNQDTTEKSKPICYTSENFDTFCLLNTVFSRPQLNWRLTNIQLIEQKTEERNTVNVSSFCFY